MVTMPQKGGPKGGFTLIELLIVIGIIGILAAIILVAVDPQKRLRQARNARRSAEVNALLNAILNYTVDNKGKLPNVLTATTTNVVLVLGTGSSGQMTATTCPNSITGAGTSTDFANFATDLVDEYIADIPVDPRGTNDTDTYNSVRTGYYAKRTTNGRVEVGSCNPEDEGDGITAIKIKR